MTVSPAFANANAGLESTNFQSVNVSTDYSEQDVKDVETIQKYLEVSSDVDTFLIRKLPKKLV
ncbi:hypothetical protein MUN88_09905 [Gracilibacillus caseinilyticus]|uniref:Uncharacterized protein n=1 Tax=Gracilibacillus caseinilyticus TaxID=2932256 RepID=A0ABY4F385_9BACI|nr:hypothetical protein [Gracilibacillus caseinilyticus]UOQ50339.1 hypothetical protein MUN88_09905 [Gracilibacillus caseinilyticus]